MGSALPQSRTRLYMRLKVLKLSSERFRKNEKAFHHLRLNDRLNAVVPNALQIGNSLLWRAVFVARAESNSRSFNSPQFGA